MNTPSGASAQGVRHSETDGGYPARKVALPFEIFSQADIFSDISLCRLSEV
jgi:hypothetical protein